MVMIIFTFITCYKWVEKSEGSWIFLSKKMLITSMLDHKIVFNNVLTHFLKHVSSFKGKKIKYDSIYL